MVAAAVRMNGLVTLTDQVQFLISSQAKPGTRKIERWSLQGLELQDIAVKSTAALDIRDVQGHVI